MPLRTVGENDAEVDVVAGPLRLGFGDCLGDPLAVLLVDSLEKGIVGGLDRVWFEPDNSVVFVRPPLCPGLRVPFPVADPGNALGFSRPSARRARRDSFWRKACRAASRSTLAAVTLRTMPIPVKNPKPINRPTTISR